MEKSFKPMLAPNEKVELTDMKLPLLVSMKLDGIRCIFKDGRMYTRSLKPFENKYIVERFQYLADLSAEKNLILDGELLAKSVPFTELSGIIRSYEQKLPYDLNFYAFDVVFKDEFDTPFATRVQQLSTIQSDLHPWGIVLPQIWMEDHLKIEEYFKEALAWGCDGLILRNPYGHYKCGRGTVKEALIFKLKPFQTFDAQIVNVLEGTRVDPNAEKKTNELGYSVTSKKKDDRIPGGYACDFVVMYEGKELRVSIAATAEEKREIWLKQQKYIGRWIEYKGMLVGAKELPRHPVFVRFRDDKE
jgi:DNA ligase-1